MAANTENVIEKGNVYEDTESKHVNYIYIEGFYVDETGTTQVRISQYTDKPIDAHNNLSSITASSGIQTLALNYVRDRILKGDLQFDENK